MAKKVQNKDIIQVNVFENTIKNGEALLVTLDAIEKRFVDILKVSKEVVQSKPTSAEDYKKVEKSIEWVASAHS